MDGLFCRWITQGAKEFWGISEPEEIDAKTGDMRE